jgi:hypothetical protein
LRSYTLGTMGRRLEFKKSGYDRFLPAAKG